MIKEEYVRQKKQKTMPPEYVLTLNNLLESLIEILKNENSENSKFKYIHVYVNKILKVLIDFFEDISIKDEIKKYINLHKHSIKKCKNKSFEMTFCICIFKIGIILFFEGFGGFFGEDISIRMSSNIYLMELSNSFKDRVEMIKNILPLDRLSYYLEIKLLSEEYINIEQERHNKMMRKRSSNYLRLL